MIRLENVALRAGHRSGLATLDLAVPTGGFRWLTGSTGAGKTNAIEIAAGRRRPEAGRVHVLGVDLCRAGRREMSAFRRRVGLIGEQPDLAGRLTLGENILLPLVLRGVRASRARRDALDIADWLGIADRLAVPAAAASRGERLLAVAARAVAARPELVLADEPTLGLGERDATRVILLLLELNRLGSTVLVATADDRAVRLHEAPVIALPGSTPPVVVPA